MDQISNQNTMEPTPEPTLAPDARDMLTLGHVVTESIIVCCIILLAIFLLVVLWVRDKLYHNFFNQFVCSLAGATLLFSLLVRPGTIHEEIRNHKLTQGYCGLYLVLLDVEWIVIPYTLLLMTIERILAIRQPEKYAVKMIKPARVSLLAAPWVLGLLFGIIKNFAMNEDIKTADEPDHKNPNHLALMGCYVTTDKKIRNIQVMLGEIIANMIPILALVTTSIILAISFCQRRHRRVDSNLNVPFVHSSSVFMTIVLDTFMVVVLIDDAAEITKLGPWVITHWLFSAVEILTLILAITLLPDVRTATNRMCCCYDVRDEYRTLINVNTSTQTNTAASLYTGETGQMNEPAVPNDNRNVDA